MTMSDEAAATGPAPVNVAILGAGTVGSAVARRLHTDGAAIAERVGARVRVSGIAVRDLHRERDLGEGQAALLTDDPHALIDGADLVIELMGGLSPAQELIEAALTQGTPVVTGNKQLIARQGPRLDLLAAEHGASLDYEAAVAGAIPVVRVVRESLAGDEISSITGIMNGSTNYILDTVARRGIPFADAVQKASDLGYLEADPTEDLEGIDAAAKIVILARSAWGVDVGMDDVKLEGISGLTDADFEEARGTGQVIKLVASAWRSGTGAAQRVHLSVAPVKVSVEHPMAQIREGRNMVQIEAALAGTVHLVGAGAGGDETASAVLGDLISAARALVAAR